MRLSLTSLHGSLNVALLLYPRTAHTHTHTHTHTHAHTHTKTHTHMHASVLVRGLHCQECFASLSSFWPLAFSCSARTVHSHDATKGLGSACTYGRQARCPLLHLGGFRFQILFSGPLISVPFLYVKFAPSKRLPLDLVKVIARLVVADSKAWHRCVGVRPLHCCCAIPPRQPSLWEEDCAGTLTDTAENLHVRAHTDT